jgi:hypothetical protein
MTKPKKQRLEKEKNLATQIAQLTAMNGQENIFLIFFLATNFLSPFGVTSEK